MRVRTLFALGLVAVLPAAALGNGGPVAWTDATPGGGVSPMADAEIALVSETLSLTVEDDARHYRASASYLLSNPSGPKTVKFGVPVLWTDDPYGERTSSKPSKGARKTAKSVAVRIGGKTHKCSIRGKSEKVQEEGVMLTHRVWCVTSVTIPKGDEVELVLTYRGEMLFEDSEFSKSALTSFDYRVLYYDLFPAGYWAGKARKVSVSVDLGRFAGLAVVEGDHGTQPKPHRASADKLSWEMTDVDLKKAKAIRVVIDPNALLTSELLMGWNKKKGRKTRAKASLTLAGKGKRYAASRALDGKGATAWCEGVEGDGVGEWIEVSFEEPKEYCRIEGFGIVPGYAKSATTYLANNRVRKVGLSTCGSSDYFDKITLDKLSKEHDRSALLLRPSGNEYGETPLTDCVRVTILEVEKGSKYRDTCMSEVAPVMNCG